MISNATEDNNMIYRPIVSVIMPVYNAGRYLRPAVESILAQTYPHWELIVIDDGSTDSCMATLDDIQDLRIRRLHQENSGKSSVMNRALTFTRGDFYALQDADDISRPERLERQVACLLSNPQVGGVYCGYELILEGRVLAPTFRAKSVGDCAREIAAGRMPGHDPTGMYRLSSVRTIRYAEDLPAGEGFDYILRVGEQFPLMVVGECLYRYRVHSKSSTRSDPSRRDGLVLEVLDRMSERRRQVRRVVRQPRNRFRRADNNLVAHFTASVADQVMVGRRLEALQTGLLCWRMHPGSAYYVKPLVYAFMPRVLMRAYRRRKEARLAADTLASSMALAEL